MIEIPILPACEDCQIWEKTYPGRYLLSRIEYYRRKEVVTWEAFIKERGDSPKNYDAMDAEMCPSVLCNYIRLSFGCSGA